MVTFISRLITNQTMLAIAYRIESLQAQTILQLRSEIKQKANKWIGN